MSEPIDKDTLLPDNRTTFERRYEEGSKALVKNEDVLTWLNDPQNTQLQLLDLMAKEAGVLDWFWSDNLAEKRQSIANAVPIHRRAGTRQGLVEALEAINVTAEIERGSKPYSIVVKTWSPKGIAAPVLARIKARVDNYKSERDSYSLSIGFKSQGLLFVGGGVIAAPKVVVGSWVPPLVESSGQIYIGGAITAAMRVIAT